MHPASWCCRVHEYIVSRTVSYFEPPNGLMATKRVLLQPRSVVSRQAYTPEHVPYFAMRMDCSWRARAVA